MSDLSAAAERLQALHHADAPLLLPNAWDASSARAVVEAGFPVVATTSSGVSAALGYADGEQTPVQEMFRAVARISRAVPGVPVSADIESGYGMSTDEIVDSLLQAGAVGCNLEDTLHGQTTRSLRDADEQAERLRAVRRAADAKGVHIVINARVDVFLLDGDLEEAITRGRRYVEAGADSVFPIGAPNETIISALVQQIPAPVNVIAEFRGAPGLQRLRELGVRRISYAGRLHRAMLTDHQRRLQTILSWQDF